MRYVVWKGEIVDRAAAVVGAMSISAQFGLSVFEGIRGYRQESGGLALFRFADHIGRLRSSAQVLAIQFPYADAQILELVQKVTDANNIKDDFAIRIILVCIDEGSWSSSVKPEVLIAPVLRQRIPIEDLLIQRASVVEIERLHAQSMPPSVKVGANYVNSRLGYLEAKSLGFDVPLFLNRFGFLSESAGANIGLFVDGTLITPALDQDILAGITRDTLLELHRRSGGLTEERAVRPDEIQSSDELFLCGTAVEVLPLITPNVSSIGHQHTRCLAEKYRQCVTGKSICNSDWLVNLDL